jgi:UDP-N-acetylglucosamine 1-carboxyvinyltransferase
MARFAIQGQQPLSGTLRPVGNKNAALPMLAASVLTDEPLVLHNVPRIVDVEVMLEILAGLGVSVERRGATVRLCAAGLRAYRLDRDLCQRVRASVLLAGPLAARHGKAVLAPPGGDVIGRRRLDTHFEGLRALGIAVEVDKDYVFTRGHLRGARLLLDEASVTATENIIMAATLAEGTTRMFHAACEPHVADLCALLVKMGARIEGAGTNLVHVHGVKALHGAEHAVGPDIVEAGSLLGAAAVTGGSLTLVGLEEDDALRVLERSLRKLNLRWSCDQQGLHLPSSLELAAQPDEDGRMPKIEDGIWPAFPSDMMSVAIVLATQARGSILFFEKMFESRMYFVDRLIEMGAQIVQCDPHRVVVQGPARLHGTHVSSPDIRAGMAMLIAALCARGTSTIDNAQMIDRGYERIDERLRLLGAAIERMD